MHQYKKGYCHRWWALSNSRLIYIDHVKTELSTGITRLFLKSSDGPHQLLQQHCPVVKPFRMIWVLRAQCIVLNYPASLKVRLRFSILALHEKKNRSMIKGCIDHPRENYSKRFLYKCSVTEL